MEEEHVHKTHQSDPRPTIGIVVPTLNAGRQIERCLGPIVHSPHAAHYKLLVIDSSSTDDTVERVNKLGVECEIIGRKDFDHGLTRNAARKKLNTPFVVCITQDAFPTSENAIERLVAPLISGSAAASFGRQIPRAGSDFIEAYAREFSYGSESFEKSWKDRARLQLRLYMCSNSFAAYDNSALDRVGGFPKTLFGEDFLTAMALIKSGGTIAYQADAVVEHSHAYDLRGEAKRNFQIGMMHSLHPEIFDGLPKRDSSGSDFARGLLKRGYQKAGVRGLTRSFTYLAARLTSYWFGRYAVTLSPGRGL
jgi:rhamnosyltransferase